MIISITLQGFFIPICQSNSDIQQDDTYSPGTGLRLRIFQLLPSQKICWTPTLSQTQTFSKTTLTPPGQTKLERTLAGCSVAHKMGRSKNYKSPSTLRRNKKRLIIHLLKVIKMLKGPMTRKPQRMHSNGSEVIVEETKEKSEIIFNLDSSSYCTSTPKRRWKICLKCGQEHYWPPDRLHRCLALQCFQRQASRQLYDYLFV